jgi:hypothetical protein
LVNAPVALEIAMLENTRVLVADIAVLGLGYG